MLLQRGTLRRADQDAQRAGRGRGRDRLHQRGQPGVGPDDRDGPALVRHDRRRRSPSRSWPRRSRPSQDIAGGKFARASSARPCGCGSSTASAPTPTENVIAETRGGDPNKVDRGRRAPRQRRPRPGHQRQRLRLGGAASSSPRRCAASTRRTRSASSGSAPRSRACWARRPTSPACRRAERAKIAAMLNFDMIGSPNFVNFVYDGDLSDSPPIAGGRLRARRPGRSRPRSRRSSSTTSSSQRIPNEPTDFDGRSDYGPFIAAGIPAGGLFTGAEGIKTPEQAAIFGGTAGEQYDRCYHLGCDDFFNISNRALDSQLRRRRARADHAGADEDPGPARRRRRPRSALGRRGGHDTRTRWRSTPRPLTARPRHGRARPACRPGTTYAPRMPSRTVLITGCSTGIGRATAARLARGRVDGLRHRPPAGDARRARGRAAAACSRSTSPPRSRCRPRSRRSRAGSAC